MKQANTLTYSIKEAADVVGCSESMMYRLIRIKGFPTVRLGARCRVSIKGLEEWIDERAKEGWYAV